MHSTTAKFYPHTCPRHNETASTWISREQCNYLANVNYKLINEINETQAEKHFYRTKLSYQFRNHHDQLEQAFRIINERNSKIIDLQQQFDRLKKDLRSAADDYIALKRNYDDEKQFYENQLSNTKATCEEKLRKMEEQYDKRYELKLKKRVQEVQNECDDRIKLFTDQINVLTQNSRQLAHELSMIQDEHRQMLLKNETIIQQSIHRQLRKRDFQAQNNYLRDIGQYQAMKAQKNRLKDQLSQNGQKIQLLHNENKRILAKSEIDNQRIKDLEEIIESYKHEVKQQLKEKFKQICEVQTNTEKQFVPIVMPIDMDLMSEVVSLKDFLVEKIIFRFLEFFQRSTSSENKKTSKSLIIFKNSLQELKQKSSQIKILLFLHTSFEKIIKLYCPSLNSFSRDYLTIKDDFIKKTLIQCQTISNQPQKLYRILQLFFRLKNPINHLHAEITPGELKLVEIKLLSCLKKNFG